MALFGSKIECVLCNTSFSKKEGRVFMENGKRGVCGICYDKWVAEGAQCTICHQGVRGTQEVGFFPQERNLGHYDCGSGMRFR
jgi:hypothetical protein